MSNMEEIKSRASKLPPVDENVVLPAAIRAAAARSSEIHKAVYEEPQAVEPKQEEKPGGENGQQEKPNAKAEEAPKEPQAEVPPNSAAGDDWQHKYNSMKGRYDGAVNTISQLNQRVASLEGLLARQQEAPKPVGYVPAELTFKGITPEERETYGDEFIDVATRAAQEKLSPELRALRQQVEELSGKLGNVATTTKQNV
jgi:hypothetical protein